MTEDSPQKPPRGLRFWLKLIAATLAVLAALGALLARGPDRELIFVREVPTTIPVATLNKSVWALSNWKDWFFKVVDVQRVNIMGQSLATKDQVIVQGALLELKLDPKKPFKRPFEIHAVVTEYVPEKSFSLRVTKESTGRLEKLFKSLEWKIELIPQPSGETLIRGTETARTFGWRARLLASLAERILLNQVFYPDLIRLGKITQPHGPNPWAPY